MNNYLKYVLPALLSLPVACASLAPAPEFVSVSYSLHFADGGQGAERSIGADGVVAGSHLTQTRSSGPILSMSKEPARAEDMVEIAALAGSLRGVAEAPAARPAGVPYDMLAVRYADGQVHTFYRARPDGSFERAAVARLVDVIRSYRAGYW